MQTAEANQILRTLVQELQLQATEAIDADGYLVASAPYLLPDGTSAEISARVRGSEFQWTILRAIATQLSDERMAWALSVADEWCLGNLHLADTLDAFNVSASIYIGAGVDAVAANKLRVALIQGVLFMRGGVISRYAPPVSASVFHLGELSQLLNQLDAAPRVESNGTIRVNFTNNGVAVSLMFYIFDGKILNVRGRLHPRFEVASYGAALRAIHNLNGRLSCGELGLIDKRWPTYHLAVSSEWSDLSEGLVQWALSKVMFVMLLAHRELGLVDGAP